MKNSSLGHWVLSILQLAMAIVLTQCAGGILFIHRANNGLYYTVMAGMWRMIDCAAKQFDVQDAKTSFDAALSLGAACRVVHSPKARAHTWLAWQDQPGESFGRAMTRKTPE
jgi:hypothetical protein